jgi:iron complex transport system permease protein
LESVLFRSQGISLAYRRRLYQRRLFLLLLVAGAGLLAAFAASRGSYRIPLEALFDLVGDLFGDRLSGGAFGQADRATWVVLTRIRLPRILAALLCGWGLSLAGLGIQSLLRNPLGSPSTLGISQGAAFGAALAIVVFGAGVAQVSLCAFAGAMAAAGLILLLARLRRLTPEAIILVGVALSSLFASATILIQFLASETELAMVVFWTFGDVARSNWGELGLLFAAVVLTTLCLIALRWDLNALALGEAAAGGLGVSVAGVRLAGILAAALVAALATAFHGVIAFVGLVGPHTARRLVGDDHRLLIPFSAVIGALLLLAADTLGRLAMGSGALPVGVLTSFLGAPMFIYLLVRGYR